MIFHTIFDVDCELKGEAWPYRTKLCDGKACIICMEGQWIEERKGNGR